MKTAEYDNFDCAPSGNVCPYCLRVNGETDGTFHRRQTSDDDPKSVLFACGYCNKKYILRFIIDTKNPSKYLPEKMKEYFKTGKLKLF